MNADAAISIQGLSFGFGPLSLFEDFSLEIPKGSFCSILGPSGCGKSTLVKLIMGALSPHRGTICIHGQSPSAARSSRLLAICPQNPALLPWLTVRQNVEMGFRIWGESPVTAQVDWALETVDLTRSANQRPSELSGGMQARAGLARAWVNPLSKILIIDETLSAVDEQLREELMAVLANLWKAQSKTVLFITHLVSDSIANSTLLVILRSPPHQGRSQPLTITENQRAVQNQRKQTLLHRVVRDVLDGNAIEWKKKAYFEELAALSRIEGHQTLIDIVNENGIPNILKLQIISVVESLIRDSATSGHTTRSISLEEKNCLREKIKSLLFNQWETGNLEERLALIWPLCDTINDQNEFQPLFFWIQRHQDAFCKHVAAYAKDLSIVDHVKGRLLQPELSSATRAVQLCALLNSSAYEIDASLELLKTADSLSDGRPIALGDQVITFVRNTLIASKHQHQPHVASYETPKHTP